jgi:hypothetical protein
VPPENREGRRIAKLFRQIRELREVRACDLDAILTEDEIDVLEFRTKSPGCTACLVRDPYGKGGGIWLEPGQDTGRRRFSIAHELGHYHIPRHRGEGTRLICADADLRARSHNARQLEWEANDFAAELLMPFRLFSADVERRDVGFASVYQLNSDGMYNVSVTAAAWRMVQVTSEACALVVSTDGKVEWVARSNTFPYGVLPERRQAILPNSLAASLLRGEGGSDVPMAVPWHAWLESLPGRPTELLESTHSIPRLRQVLSLLWIVDTESDE